MAPLRLVFLGSDPIALPLLDWLVGPGTGLAQVIAVFTQPDRPAGRGQQIAPNAIKTWALAREVPVYQPEKLTDESRLQLAALSADVSLVMAYGHLLRDEFIATPRLGTLNLHASILPKYRGASPIQTAIASGERETGVSLMRIVRRLDAGPVADVERVSIGPHSTASEVEAGLGSACVPLLSRTLPSLRDGYLVFVPQDETGATYCRRLQKNDGALDFTGPAAALAARINGLFPWPATSVAVAGQAIKLGLADVVPVEQVVLSAVGLAEVDDPAHNAHPGLVLGQDQDGLLIATGSGVLRVRCLQRPGARMLPAAEFLRGFPLATGLQLASRPMPPLVSHTPFRRELRS